MVIFAASNFEGVGGTLLATFDTAFVRHPGHSANAQITAAGQVRPSTSSTTLYYHGASPPSADYTAEVLLHRPGTDTSAAAGPCVRCSPTALTYYHARYSRIVAGLQLYQFVNGKATLLASASAAIPITGSFTRLALKATGGTLEVFFGESSEAAITVTNTRITAAGYAGMRWAGGSSSDTANYHFDDFNAYDDSAPTVGRLKHWTGSSWQVGTLKAWTGSAWRGGSLKRYDGSNWVE